MITNGDLLLLIFVCLRTIEAAETRDAKGQVVGKRVVESNALWHDRLVQKVVRVFHSFQESEKADREYYLSLSPEQRMEILFELIARGQPDEPEQGFERVYRIVKFGER